MNQPFSKTLVRTIPLVVCIVIFIAGFLLGLALVAVITWADFEAVFYGFDNLGGRPLTTLQCPVILDEGEAGEVSLKLKNPTKKVIEPLVRAEISSSGPFRRVINRVSIPPGETRKYSITVTSKDIDLGFFILLKVYVYPFSTLKLREATCGILITDLGAFTGAQVLVFFLITSFVCMAVGLFLWQTRSRPLVGRKLSAAWAMRLMGLVMLVGVFSSLMGWLVLTVMLLVVSLLMIGVMIYYIASSFT